MKRPQVLYLDGIRGIAALMVVFHHAFRHTLSFVKLQGSWGYLTKFLSILLQGRPYVAVFIVLSGYVLMRPTLSEGHINGGLGRYFLRRARRILPPYFAALIGSLLLIAFYPPLKLPLSVEWAPAIPLSTRSIVAHFFLIHNFSSTTILKINPPLWTVAIEWQIYFLFPLILLPLCRTSGSAFLIMLSFALTIGGHLAFGVGNSTAPWFVGLFALGMMAATFEGKCNRQIASFARAIAVFAFIVFSSISMWFGLRRASDIEDMFKIVWVTDVIVGTGTAAMLIWLGAMWESGRAPKVFLEKKPFVLLGGISYSLYLVHDPLLAVARSIISNLALTPVENFLVMITIAVPIVVAIAFCFSSCFEQPWLHTSRKTVVERETALSLVNGAV